MSLADKLDLSGAWQGLFHYPIVQAPVSFRATLHDADGILVGSTEETGEIGDAAGRMISATLQGRRTAFSVTWLKIYDGDFQHYDAVRYEGAVSEDGLEIEGRWTVPGHWSGTFLMIRAASATREVEEAIAAR